MNKPIPSENSSQRPKPDLKNPLLAGIFAWLLPGLGHFYQGRKGKAILFFCCIFPVFLLGCYIGSDKEYGVARVVYCSWSQKASHRDSSQQSVELTENRYYFIPQACLGVAAVPALIQSNRVNKKNLEPLWGGMMAPPSQRRFDTEMRPGQNPSLNQLIARMGRRFDIGTIYTVIAGLMNVLVILDALRGPLYEIEEDKKKPVKK